MVPRAWAHCRFSCLSLLLIFCLEVAANGKSAGGDLVTSVTSAEHPRSSSIVTWWEEVIEPDPTTISNEGSKLSRSREDKRIFLNLTSWFQKGIHEKSESRELPHPLRTNLWEMNCRWRGLARQSKSGLYSHCKLVLDFDPSGYVRVRPSDDSSRKDDWITIGKWKLEPSGVTFALPFPFDDKIETARRESTFIMHHFETDFHINPFGRQPKFTRGVVFRENGSKWLRPVVATFTATGIGNDTADLSYRKRKLPK